jgi:hypothetical protein
MLAGIFCNEMDLWTWRNGARTRACGTIVGRLLTSFQRQVARWAGSMQIWEILVTDGVKMTRKTYARVETLAKRCVVVSITRHLLH